jgi:hypothetical protein
MQIDISSRPRTPELQCMEFGVKSGVRAASPHEYM